jgi:AraC-like DNA-binding protein
MRTVSAQYYRGIFEGCIAAGCDPETLKSEVSIDPESITNPTERIDAPAVLTLLHGAERLTGIKGIGIEVGQSFRPKTFLDIGYGSIYCSNIIEAINFNNKYQRLTQEIGVTHINIDGPVAEIIWDTGPHDDEYLRPMTDCVFGGYFTLGLWMAWVSVESVRSRVEFKHAQVGYKNRFEKAFNCDTHFESGRNALVFPAEIAKKPFPQHNPELCQIVAERLDLLMEKMSEPQTLTERAYRIIESKLSEKSLSVGELASIFGETDRTFRRNLAKEGTSYRQLLETVRKETCQILIFDKTASLADVAFSLGYNDQSAFNKAFVEWFGTSPGQYRKSKQILKP